MKSIVILGAGELGKEVIWLIEDINRIKPTWVILGFLDDTKEKGTVCSGYPVLGTIDELTHIYDQYACEAVIAVQEGRGKADIQGRNKDFDHWTSIIHPTAVIAPESTVGEGSIVFPQVTVSVDSKIGKHSLLYIHSIVCNDCILGDFVSIMSGVSLAEHVSVGEESYISAGCNIYPHITVGAKCHVAVGTTVDEDIRDGTELKKSKGMFFK